MGFSIALCQPWDTDLGITVSAAYCSGGIAVCGLLALLAMNQAGNVHWIMVLMLDLIALAWCGGAAGVGFDHRYHNRWWRLTFDAGPHESVHG